MHVAALEAGADPDSTLVKEGPVAIMHALMQAQEYLPFLVARRSKEVRLESPAEKNRLLQEIVQTIRSWDNGVMVHESLKKLAHLVNVPEELLGVGGVVPLTVQRKKSMAASSMSPHAVDPDRVLEADLIRWLILSPTESIGAICARNLEADDFLVPVAQKIYRYIMSVIDAKQGLDLLRLVAEIEHEDVQPFLAEISNKKINLEKAREGVMEAILKIKERNWMMAREKVMAEIQAGQGSEAEIMQLAMQFDALKRSAPQVI